MPILRPHAAPHVVGIQRVIVVNVERSSYIKTTRRVYAYIQSLFAVIHAAADAADAAMSYEMSVHKAEIMCVVTSANRSVAETESLIDASLAPRRT